MAKKKTRTKAKPATKKKAVRKAAKKAAPRRAARASARPARPNGYAPVAVTPGFTANDAARTIAWYCDVLGFSRKDHWEVDGVYRGGSVAFGNITINIGQDDWKLGRDRQKGQGVRIYITTGPDIDAYAGRIKANGGTLDHEPVDGWGVRSFSVSDPDGYKITFMRPLA